MKTAVIFGAGNIGRGFIGALFSASGYKTIFIDLSLPLIEALNRRKQYPVRILSETEVHDITVTNVEALCATEEAAVAEAIAEAEILATAVGANVLKNIVPNLLRGLDLRKQRHGKPINLLLCENLMNANRVFWQYVEEMAEDKDLPRLRKDLGLVETSIGRMVPIQTDEMKDGDPLRICVEHYGFLPVDKDAFRGKIPEISGMIPFSPFEFYVKRKLYIHNLGHALCAYLGNLTEKEYIADAIRDPEICLLTKAAMQESAVALAKEYGVPLWNLMDYIDDLLLRFANTALKDTCKRVGNDPRRKLSPEDRLIGAAKNARAQGIDPQGIAVGIAAALFRFLSETEPKKQSEAAAKEALTQIAELSPEDALVSDTLEFYGMLRTPDVLPRLRLFAERKKGAARGSVV